MGIGRIRYFYTRNVWYLPIYFIILYYTKWLKYILITLSLSKKIEIYNGKQQKLIVKLSANKSIQQTKKCKH